MRHIQQHQVLRDQTKKTHMGVILNILMLTKMSYLCDKMYTISLPTWTISNSPHYLLGIIP